jgi:hypothetical protein
VEAVPARALKERGTRPIRRPRRAQAARRRGVWRYGIALAAATVLVGWMGIGSASATIVVAKDFAALCAEADLIFIGTVSRLESRWSDPSRQAIETLVTFDDLTWLRGAEQSSITLRFGGGEVDGLREEIAGAPRFVVGERRVIFAREGRFVSPVVGFDQGAMRVLDGPDGPVVVGTGEATSVDVDNGAAGALRLGATPGTGEQPPGSVKAAPVPLDAFVDRVRRQLNGTP